MGTMRARLVLLVLTVSVALAACATPTTPGSTGGTPSGERTGPEEGPIDWDNPIRGEPVELDQASDVVGFTVIAPPSELGHPAGIFAVPEADGYPGAIDFVYDLDIGRVVIGEFVWDFPEERWEGWVSSVVVSGPGTVIGSARSEQLGSDRFALITTSEDGSRSDIRWLEPGDVQIVIQGPELSAEDAESLAEDFIA
jgi:hypothetical protein